MHLKASSDFLLCDPQPCILLTVVESLIHMHCVGKTCLEPKGFTLDSTGLNDALGDASGFCAAGAGRNPSYLRHGSQRGSGCC